MGLFGLGKKKETKTACSCGSQCSGAGVTEANIMVLGACCKKSSDTFENVKTAVLEMGIDENVINVGDLAEIAKYGVMSTPALVVNGKVVSMGKLIKVNEAKALIEKAGF